MKFEKEQLYISNDSQVTDENRKYIVSKLRELADDIESHKLPLIHEFEYDRYFHHHTLKIMTSWFMGG